jgi:hypothetical protein
VVGLWAQRPAYAALHLRGHPKETFTDAEATAAQPIAMAPAAVIEDEDEDEYEDDY